MPALVQFSLTDDCVCSLALCSCSLTLSLFSFFFSLFFLCSLALCSLCSLSLLSAGSKRTGFLSALKDSPARYLFTGGESVYVCMRTFRCWTSLFLFIYSPFKWKEIAENVISMISEWQITLPLSPSFQLWESSKGYHSHTLSFTHTLTHTQKR